MTNYENELKEQFDWEALKQDCLQSAVETLHDRTLDELQSSDLTDGEAIVGQAYLGTVFALTPSGKYYTPWANSNVESCSECDGDGHARGACEFDANEYHNFEDDCFDFDGNLMCDDCPFDKERQGNTPIIQDCSVCKGQGKRDLYELAKLRNEHPVDTVKFLTNTWGVKVHCDDLPTLRPSFDCNVCHGSGEQYITCPTCNGLGSAEAYQDQLWYEALEQVCESYDMWHEASEGNATDIMVGRWVSFEEIARYILEQHVAIVQGWLDGKATVREVKEGLRVAKSLVNKMVQIEKNQ